MDLGEKQMNVRKGNLMDVRDDIQVLDATIRDGGLCNNFEFTDEFVTELYKTNVKSGIDYMEFGYKSSKTMFNCGNAIFNGIPGNPAPVPISITVLILEKSHTFTDARLSRKCFATTSSYSVMAVRFMTLFHSTSIS